MRGAQPVAVRSLVLSQTSRITSEAAGRSRWSSRRTGTGRPISSQICSASAPIEISSPVPALKISPTTCSAGAVPTVAKAAAVSCTNRKSRVGSSAPSRISRAPAAIWLTTVGMTARADCRGPNVLNGRSVTAGRPKLAW